MSIYGEKIEKIISEYPFMKERFAFLLGNSEGSILDVGCGYGEILETIFNSNSNEVAGIDFDWDRVMYCRDKFRNASFHCLDITSQQIPYDPNSFDTVIISEVLEHVRPIQAHFIIEEAYRVAKKKVLITTPNGSADHLHYLPQVIESANHFMIYTPELFHKFLSPGGRAKQWYGEIQCIGRPMSNYKYMIEVSQPYNAFILVQLLKEEK